MAALPSMDAGLFEQRSQMAFALRTGSRVALGLFDQRAQGRRVRAGWAAATVVALLGDAVHRRWLATDPRPHRVVRTLLDSVDAAVWAHAGRVGPSTARHVQLGTVVVPALEGGFRLRAGTVAVPGLSPGEPWPIPAGRRFLRVASSLAPAVVPYVSMRVVRRRLGFSWRRLEDVWGCFAYAGGVSMARYRDRLHAEARSAWRERAEHLVSIEARRTVIQVAMRSSRGHDFKKVLHAIGDHGSAGAAAAAREQMSRPSSLLEEPDGRPLRWITMKVPVDPPEAGYLWLANSQVARVDAFLAETDDMATDTEPPVVKVGTVDSAGFELSYRGRLIRLDNPPPRLETALDPIPVVLWVSAGWKALAAVHPDAAVPRWVAAATAGVDLTLAVVYRRRLRDSGSEAAIALVGLLASTLVYDVAIRLSNVPSHDAAGEPVFPATAAACGVLGLIAATSGEIAAPVRWGSAIAVVAGWVFAADPRSRSRWVELAVDGISLWQVVAASHGLMRSLGSEVGALEVDLQREFSDRLSTARLEAISDELERYRRQADLATAEMARLADKIDTDLAQDMRLQVEELTSWLDDSETPARLMSW